MRIRRNYWFVPALAILGILFALMHFYYKPKIPADTLILDPKEPPPPLPAPSAPPTASPAQPAPEAAPAASAPTAPAPEAAPAPQK